jgi:hypothetical protein
MFSRRDPTFDHWHDVRLEIFIQMTTAATRMLVCAARPSLYLCEPRLRLEGNHYRKMGLVREMGEARRAISFVISSSSVAMALSASVNTIRHGEHLPITIAQVPFDGITAPIAAAAVAVGRINGTTDRNRPLNGIHPTRKNK